MKEIDKGIRVANFIVDTFVIVNISEILKGIVFQQTYKSLIVFIVWLVYYFAFESYNGRTLGKLLTKTIVVDMKNSRPGVLRILLRTILRINPFDSFSYLFGKEQGAHDLLSKTRLIFK